MFEIIFIHSTGWTTNYGERDGSPPRHVLLNEYSIIQTSHIFEQFVDLYLHIFSKALVRML